jgi:hypothetical protein
MSATSTALASTPEVYFDCHRLVQVLPGPTTATAIGTQHLLHQKLEKHNRSLSLTIAMTVHKHLPLSGACTHNNSNSS